ncbi:helix-turn-helix domain-containing protein [Nocardia veterana]|uniref:Helix-turn-helix domain-containing protein n=2 Tax=Nocardia veterana TaxID=132249 RepID=A0A7X6M4Z4_9NOCA|nr:helix-turn-helix transcriptional regulator [Nocardia veterana]NKY89836.1 helix-turn-helix domain-containing protein [Nocardia veterana]
MGRELRRLRNAKGMGQSQAARIAETSHQTIGRIEEGQTTRITSLQVNALCDSYGATDEERRICLDLVKEIRASREGKVTASWWRAYADAQDSGFDHYLALEDAASRMTVWKTTILPGLLQTPAYRRTMGWAERPEMPSEQLERRIEWQSRRQERLKDPNFHITALLYEAVLHERVGGTSVYAEQLEQLVTLSELPNLCIRVVPFDSSSHLGAYVGSFMLLEFPDLISGLAQPPIIYVEGWTGDLYLEREAELRRYFQALREITRVALSEAESVALIKTVSHMDVLAFASFLNPVSVAASVRKAR